MAKNVVINGSNYNSVPSVQIPLQGGGGNAVFYDTSDADITAAQVASGYYAYGSSGKLQGSLSVPTISQDGSSHILTIS